MFLSGGFMENKNMFYKAWTHIFCNKSYLKRQTHASHKLSKIFIIGFPFHFHVRFYQADWTIDAINTIDAIA